MTLAACLAGTALLSACSGFDGFELQGGVFDALGVGTNSGKKMADVKVEPRPGLVLPPSKENLPAPVTGSIAAGPDGESWPVDPEDRRVAERAALDKRHQEYCERAIQQQRMRGETGVVMGPKGNCQPGLFGSLTNVIEGKK